MSWKVYYRKPDSKKWIRLSEFVNRGAAVMEYEIVLRKGYEAKIV